LVLGGTLAMAADRPMDIRIELQIVAIPEDLELPLVADFLRKDRVEAAHGKIQELLAQKACEIDRGGRW